MLLLYHQNLEKKTVKSTQNIFIRSIGFFIRQGSCPSKASAAKKKMQEKYEHQGLQIVGVSVDSDREKWEGALAKHHTAGIQISEMKGWESTSRVDYGVQAIPITVLIDASGKIHARNPHGPLLEEIIEKYFSRK